MPRQARSEATVAAIFEATIQLLLTDGMRRLTTTRVAARAGVSVGTLYQYFPHKEALLFGLLQRHVEAVAVAVEAAALGLRTKPLAAIAEGLVLAYVDAKISEPAAARALYLVWTEFDTAPLLDGVATRLRSAVATLLASAADASFEDLPAVAFMLLTAMSGAVRVAVERDDTPAAFITLRDHLGLMCGAYLRAAAGAPLDVR